MKDITFQDRIRLAFLAANEKRQDRGQPSLKKTDLWKAAGLTSAATTHWFNGSNPASLENCFLIAPLLEVNPHWLFDRSCGMYEPYKLDVQKIADGRKRGELHIIEVDEHEQELIDSYRALPDGWKYYVNRKALELANIASALPAFLKDSLKAIPENGSYREWEKNLDAFVEQQRAKQKAEQ